MRWTPLDFGRHKGKTLPQIVFQDPDWLFWAVKDGVFNKRKYLKQEVNEINEKARRIRIPQNNGSELVALYTLDRNGHFCCLRTIAKSQVPFWRGPPILLNNKHPFIDLSVPKRLKGYDKRGYRLFIKDMKAILFGHRDCRMTQRRCEEFFNDDSNFLISRSRNKSSVVWKMSKIGDDYDYHLAKVYLKTGNKALALEEYEMLKTLDEELANELFELMN